MDEGTRWAIATRGSSQLPELRYPAGGGWPWVGESGFGPMMKAD